MYIGILSLSSGDYFVIHATGLFPSYKPQLCHPLKMYTYRIFPQKYMHYILRHVRYIFDILYSSISKDLISLVHFTSNAFKIRALHHDMMSIFNDPHITPTSYFVSLSLLRTILSQEPNLCVWFKNVIAYFS